MTQEQAYDLDKKYLTQQEVAELFRVRPGTIKKWRDAGYLDYFQVPGSSRVIYPIESVNQFEQQHTTKAKVVELKRPDNVKKKEGQGLSSNRIKKDWRI